MISINNIENAADLQSKLYVLASTEISLHLYLYMSFIL